MNTLYRKIAWKVMNLRQSEELTQIQLGKKIGLSKFQISRIERGFGDTTLDNIQKIADYFEIPLHELFKEEQKVPLVLEFREDWVEKTKNGSVRSFSRKFNESAKIKTLSVPPKSIKRLRLDSEQTMDLVLLKGKVSIQSPDDCLQMHGQQILSAKGVGGLRLANAYEAETTLMIITY